MRHCALAEEGTPAVAATRTKEPCQQVLTREINLPLPMALEAMKATEAHVDWSERLGPSVEAATEIIA